MNQLYIGTKRVVEPPKKGGYLLIADTVPKVRGAQLFDPKKHSFNALAQLDYRRICDIIDIFDAVFSRGDSTLTKDTGLDFIAERLAEKPRSFADLIPEPDKKATTGHIWAHGKIQRLLRSPVLRRVLCGTEPLSFKPSTVVLARVNRAELGEFDALVIGLFLMAQFKGQLVVPDLGFYGRDLHTTLLREERLIAGIDYLDQLPEKLRKTVLLVEDKVPAGALYDDAETLAKHAGLVPDRLREDNPYNDAIREAMG